MTAGRKNSGSLTKDWCTPPKYIKAIHQFFGDVELDPCSNDYSIVKAKTEFKLPETDGLKQKWNYKTIFVNPPYGRDDIRKTTIKNWLKKCYESFVYYGSEVMALVPVATNTSHWKLYVWEKASAICFFSDTRLKFYIDGEEYSKGAPMSCCMIYWGNRKNEFKNIFKQYGAVVFVSVTHE